MRISEIFSTSSLRLLAFACLFWGFVGISEAESIESRHFIMNEADWDLVTRANSQYTPASFLAEADYYWEQITEYLSLHRSETDKILIQIVHNDKFFGRAEIDHIYIDHRAIEKKIPTLAHEITHVLYFSVMLRNYSEGIADFMAEYFTLPEIKDSSILWYTDNVHAVVRNWWDSNFDLVRLERTMIGSSLDWNYAETFSMVKFLVERFGIKKFQEYFDSAGYLGHLYVFGFSAEQLTKDWIDCVMQNPLDKVMALRLRNRTQLLARAL